MNGGNVSRRSIIRGAAWSMPVILSATAVPLAAASEPYPPQPPMVVCKPQNIDEDVESVTFDGNVMTIWFKPYARNWVDVTVRIPGYSEIHLNLGAPGQPTNGVAHMKNYVPGQGFTVPLPVPYELARDWCQVKTIHNENCVEVAR